MYYPAAPNRSYSLSLLPAFRELYFEFRFHLYNRIQTLLSVTGALSV